MSLRTISRYLVRNVDGSWMLVVERGERIAMFVERIERLINWLCSRLIEVPLLPKFFGCLKIRSKGKWVRFDREHELKVGYWVHLWGCVPVSSYIFKNQLLQQIRTFLTEEEAQLLQASEPDIPVYDHYEEDETSVNEEETMG